MNRSRMDIVVSGSRNSLERIYRAGYDAGRDDAEKEYGARYAVNVLNQLANVLRGEIKDRGYSSYIADGLHIALREIDDMKDYIGAGGEHVDG